MLRLLVRQKRASLHDICGRGGPTRNLIFSCSIGLLVPFQRAATYTGQGLPDHQVLHSCSSGHFVSIVASGVCSLCNRQILMFLCSG